MGDAQGANFISKYSRLWPVRGSQTFEFSLSYGVSVGLIALAGVSSALLLLAISVAVCCCRCSCVRCLCCTCSGCSDCHDGCMRCRRRKNRKQDRRGIFFVWLTGMLVLFAMTGAALFVSLFGMLDAAHSLSRIGPLVLNLSRIASVAATAILEFPSWLQEMVPSADEFLRALIDNVVVPILELAGVDVSSTAEIVRGVFSDINRYVSLTRDIACIIPPVLIGSNMGLMILIILGQGIAIAGCAVSVVALLRGKRDLIASGFLILFSGLIFALFSFAFTTPVSVWIDDGCYTTNAFLRSSSVIPFLFTCVNTEQLRNPIIGILNMSRFVYMSTLLPIMQNTTIFSNGSTAAFSMPPLNVSGSNVMIISEFQISSIVPAIASLRVFSAAGVVRAVAVLLRVGQWYFEGLNFVSDLLLYVGDCSSLFFRDWMRTINDSVCKELPTGLGISVWTVFAALSCLILGLVLFMIGHPLLGVAVISPRLTATLCFSALSSILCLIFGLVLTYSDQKDVGTYGFFFALVALFLVIFLLASLPNRVWKTELRQRLFWATISVFAVACTGLAAAILGLSADPMTKCWAQREVCTFACTPLVVTSLTVSVGVASFATLAGIIVSIVAIVSAIKLPPQHAVFFGDLEHDWTKHSVELTQRKAK